MTPYYTEPEMHNSISNLASTHDSPARSSRETIISFSLIFVACALLGWMATRFNHRFYSTNQPFFDSIAYHESTHRIMSLCKTEGLFAALKQAISIDTVCLPYLLAAFVGLFVEPTRYVGIWIQVGEFTLFCWTLWIFFTRVHRVSAIVALLAIIPFLLMKCLYLNNGGLSDYRMDLSLALLFGTSCLWYLIASHGTALWPFFLFGIACGATCLFRGTAPVYFVLVVGPVVAWDLMVARRNNVYIRGLAIAGITATALSLWFYIFNFSRLYYYYFVWNTDANARLPFRESINHFSFILKHLGGATIAYLVAFQVVMLWARLARSNGSFKTASSELFTDLRGFDFRPLWLGLAPAMFLVLRGAGLNPFVSMPSVVGLCLFSLFPMKLRNGLLLNRQMIATLLLVGFGCSVWVYDIGWRNHQGDSPNSMSAHQQTLDAIVSDIRDQGKSGARFATIHSFYLNTHSLKSVAVFDRQHSISSNEKVIVDGVALIADGLMSLSAEADWNRIEGESDDAKITQLLKAANSQLDYLIIPTAECSEFLKKNISHNVINRYVVSLREKIIESKNWEVISIDIANRSDEIVQVFRKTSPNLAIQSSKMVR